MLQYVLVMYLCYSYVLVKRRNTCNTLPTLTNALRHRGVYKDTEQFKYNGMPHNQQHGQQVPWTERYGQTLSHTALDMTCENDIC